MTEFSENKDTRLKQEYQNYFEYSRDSGFIQKLSADIWKIRFEGPEDKNSIWHGHFYDIEANLTKYPRKIIVKFKTPFIPHPNVSQSDGNICYSIISSWNTHMTILELVNLLRKQFLSGEQALMLEFAKNGYNYTPKSKILSSWTDYQNYVRNWLKDSYSSFKI